MSLSISLLCVPVIRLLFDSCVQISVCLLIRSLCVPFDQGVMCNYVFAVQIDQPCLGIYSQTDAQFMSDVFASCSMLWGCSEE